MAIVHLLEPSWIAENRHRWFRGLDMRVIFAQPQAFTDDLRDTLSSGVRFSGKGLAVDEDDLGHCDTPGAYSKSTALL
jgi:hypothetical protein